MPLARLAKHARGIGLRFPRFERVRPDKKSEEETSIDQILEMYYAQDLIVGSDNIMVMAWIWMAYEYCLCWDVGDYIGVKNS